MINCRWLLSMVACLTVFFTTERSDAALLTPGQSATINFTSTTGTPPFDFVTLSLNFSSADPFGTNETLKFSTFDANNMALTSATVYSGNSVYTSGLGAALTENAIVPFSSSTALATPSFRAIVTDVTGSFDLIAAQASFEHILTSGANQLGVNGTISAVPLPGAFLMTGTALIGIASFGALRRRRQKQGPLSLTA